MKYPCNVLFEYKVNLLHRPVGPERQWGDQLRPLWALPDRESDLHGGYCGDREGEERRQKC